MSLKKILFTLITLSITSYAGLGVLNPDAVKAATPVADAAPNLLACMGQALAAFMNALLAAKANGTLPANVHLLSPAFNGTSSSFEEIYDSISSGGGNYGGLDGIAVNIYNTSGGSMADYAQRVKAKAGNKPIYITEAGCHDMPATCNQNLKDTITALLGVGVNIKSVILFNPSGSNSDPNFEQHHLSDEDIHDIMTSFPGITGINTGTSFGTGGDVTQYNPGWTVSIGNSGNITETANTINNSSGKVIIRIGVGSDSGGFTNVNDYISYLAAVAAATPGKEFYALAGPNEPDAEFWAFEQCMLLFPNEVPNFVKACGGPVDMEHVKYRGEVVGFREKPFSLAAVVKDSQGGDSTEGLAKVLSGTLTLTATYDHTDFRQPARQYTGSTDPNHIEYIDRKAKIQMEDGQPHMYSSGIPQLIWQVPGNHVPGSFIVATQASYHRAVETYKEYTKRIFGESIRPKDPTGRELGSKGDMPTLAFHACIQRVGCDASVEGGSKCVSRKSTSPGSLDNYFCQAGRDDPKDCLSLGHLFEFKGLMTYQEPPDLQSTARVDEYYKKMMIPPIKYHTEHEDPKPYFKYADAMNQMPQPDSAYSSSQPKTALTSVSNPTKAAAAVERQLAEAGDPGSVEDQIANGTFQTTTGANCSGMTMAIENRGGTSYSIHAWDTQPMSCNSLYDYNLTVQYFDNGTYVGGCSLTQVGHSTIPKYDDDGNPNAKWGLPITDLGGAGQSCAAPVVPTAGHTFTANVIFTHSNAPGDVDGCQNTAQCIGGPIVNIHETPKPIDCRICSSWAPAALCTQIVADELVHQDECVDGKCVGSTEIQSNIFGVDDWGIHMPDIGSWIDSFISFLYGHTGVNCDVHDHVENNVVVSHSISCHYDATNYLIYTYPEPLEGDLFGRGLKHMDMHDALSKVPGVTTRYFVPESGKQLVKLTMSIGDNFKTDNNLPKTTSQQEALDASGNNVKIAYAGFAKPGLDNIRNMYVEYYLFKQPQVSGYCLTQKFLTQKVTEDKKIPQSIIDSHFCDTQDFFKSGQAASASSTVSQAPNQQANGTVVRDNYTFDTKQITNDINDHLVNMRNNDVAEKISTDSNAKMYLDRLTPQQVKELRASIRSEIQFIVEKNVHLFKKSDPDYVPEQFKNDLRALTTRYDAKIKQLVM